MESAVLTKSYSAPEINRREILRYAGVAGDNAAKDMLDLMEECISEAEKAKVFSYKVSYRILPVKIIESDEAVPEIDFTVLKVTSRDLAKNLSGCDSCILMTATVGYAIDRLIEKYNRLNPAKALFMQALGAERVEALCDAFCSDDTVLSDFTEGGQKLSLRPRFSPGYGDVSLSVQKDFLAVCNAGKNLGITLGESLLMSPSKSVTAFAGIK